MRPLPEPPARMVPSFFSARQRTCVSGAVTAGVYLPNLPPTMHAVVSNDTSNAAQAAVKYHSFDHQAHPLGYIVDGALKIDLDIKPAI